MLARLRGAPLLLVLVLGCGSEPDEKIFGTFVMPSDAQQASVF